MDISTLFRVDGMVAVITGGGTGIGLTMAHALAAAGASKVYILGRRASVLTTASSSSPHLDVLTPIVCDVSSKTSLQSAVDTITATSGYVNLVIANAGTLGPGTTFPDFTTATSAEDVRREMFDEMDMESFTESLHVNVTAAYFTMLAFLGLLQKGNENAVSRGGFGKPLSSGSEGENEGSKVPSVQSQVIFTSSVSAFSRDRSSPPAYAAGKAAIAHLAQHAATGLAGWGIRVNTLAPGFFNSEMATPLIAHRNPETEEPGHPHFMPARRFGTEEELAGTVLYLASRAGSYCNGTIFTFDGGRLAVIPSTHLKQAGFEGKGRGKMN